MDINRMASIMATARWQIWDHKSAKETLQGWIKEINSEKTDTIEISSGGFMLRKNFENEFELFRHIVTNYEDGTAYYWTVNEVVDS